MNESVVTARLPFIKVDVGPDMPEPLDAARKIVSLMFELDAPREELRQSYAMNLRVYDLGNMQISTCKASASIYRRSAAWIAATRTDHFVLQLYRNSSFDMIANDKRAYVAPQTVAFFDLLSPGTIETDAVDNLALAIPREVLAPLIADIENVHGLVLETESETNVALVMHLEDLWQRLPEMTLDAAVEECRSLIAMIAAIIGAHHKRRSMARAHLRKNQFSAICRWIDEHLADPKLEPRAIVDKFHITRPTLYRMFEQRGGIMRYILERRLERTYRDLIDPALLQEKISAIMSRCGLPDQTSAGRAFRSYFGITPSQARIDVSAPIRYATFGGTETFRVQRIEQLGPILEPHKVKVSHALTEQE